MVVIDPSEFGKIVSVLDAGNVVALPTDTVFGLVCKFDYEEAIAKIYQIKKRPLAKAFPILLANWEQAKKFGIFDEHLVKHLEENFSNGQVTVIVKKQYWLNNIKYWQQWDCIAIRVTGCPTLQNIITTVGPLIATSCNISGEKVVNEASKINLPGLEYLVDGEVANPKASTIYDSIKEEIIRA